METNEEESYQLRSSHLASCILHLDMLACSTDSGLIWLEVLFPVRSAECAADRCNQCNVSQDLGTGEVGKSCISGDLLK